MFITKWAYTYKYINFTEHNINLHYKNDKY